MIHPTTPTGTPTEAIRDATGALTTLIVKMLNERQLRNWEDAIFVLGLTANALTTLAATRTTTKAEQYRERAAEVMQVAMAATVMPIPKESH